MTQSVLILGATGMAGHVLATHLKEKGYSVSTTSRDMFDEHHMYFDVLNYDSHTLFFSKQKPSVIVNCIGILVAECQKYPQNAKSVNSYFPYFLEKFYADSDTKIIHISTDCVFDGARGSYLDTDTPNETHIYGRSKALGEINNTKDVTLRTSIIGPERTDRVGANTGLLHWFLSQKPCTQIHGFSKCLWSGISTLELCDAVLWAMHSKEAVGIKQISRRIPISKFELLSLANDVFKKELIITEDASKVIDKSLIPSQISFEISTTYAQMLRDLHTYISKNKDKYPY
jgi:dTDP-4-dehydrorhamnose reductase